MTNGWGIKSKKQIAAHVAKECNLSQKKASAILAEISKLAISETKKAGAFTLPGIGKLVLSKRKARMGRNPATGTAIRIPSKTVVKLRMSKAMKEAIAPAKKSK